MELELKRDAIHCFETVADVTICQEETQEAIVPDACPDIWQVLDGEARLLLQRKEPQDGKGEFSGLLKTTILYQPEGEQGLRAMEVTLPFSASPELTQLTRRSMLHVIPGSPVSGCTSAQPPEGSGPGGILLGHRGL